MAVKAHFESFSQMPVLYKRIRIQIGKQLQSAISLGRNQHWLSLIVEPTV